MTLLAPASCFPAQQNREALLWDAQRQHRDSSGGLHTDAIEAASIKSLKVGTAAAIKEFSLRAILIPQATVKTCRMCS
jgi:hypothetical protein